jgi:serine/threonine-protein kinase
LGAPEPQTLIAGRYVVGESFASGGMGTVHLGRLVGAGGFARVVAVKKLFPGLAADRTFREMLLDEARFASRIRHPNVVPALDVVEADRDLYIVMEYVHGVSLSHLLEQRAAGEPIPIAVAAGIMESVLLGLHAAHEARGEDGTPLGIVHRDVSPHNILVGADGVPRLIDFGIAKAATRMQVTDPGVLKGKAAYMAPEQLLHDPVSRRADVYAAGVVLWELIANRRLFSGIEIAERARRAGELQERPSRHRRDSDTSLDDVALRAISPDPEARFPTAEAMATAIRQARMTAAAVDVAAWLAGSADQDLEISAERVQLFERGAVSPASTETPVVSSVVTQFEKPTPPPRRGRRLRVIGATLATVAGIAGIALWAATHRAPAAAAIAPLAPLAPPAPTLSAPASAEPPSATPLTPPPSASIAAQLPAKPSAGPAGPGGRPPVVRSRTRSKRCDPPYTVDANGFKHYDPACF